MVRLIRRPIDDQRMSHDTKNTESRHSGTLINMPYDIMGTVSILIFLWVGVI